MIAQLRKTLPSMSPPAILEKKLFLYTTTYGGESLWSHCHSLLVWDCVACCSWSPHHWLRAKTLTISVSPIPAHSHPASDNSDVWQVDSPHSSCSTASILAGSTLLLPGLYLILSHLGCEYKFPRSLQDHKFTLTCQVFAFSLLPSPLFLYPQSVPIYSAFILSRYNVSNSDSFPHTSSLFCSRILFSNWDARGSVHQWPPCYYFPLSLPMHHPSSHQLLTATGTLWYICQLVSTSCKPQALSALHFTLSSMEQIILLLPLTELLSPLFPLSGNGPPHLSFLWLCFVLSIHLSSVAGDPLIDASDHVLLTYP